MTLLEDVGYLSSAAAATARARQLIPEIESSPGADVSTALHCIGAYDEYLTEEQLASLESEELAAPLVSAARTLISVADEIRKAKGHLPDSEEGLLLHAAIAFAMHGNFPNARVAVLSSADEYRSRTPARRFAWAICDPSAIEKIVALADGLTDEVAFYRAWREALQRCDRTALDVAAELLKKFTVSPDVSDTALLLSAEVAFRQAFRLSVAQLKHGASGLPAAFIDRLIDSGRWTLLPPQRRLLSEYRVAAASQNSLLNLPTSTGKTLIAEACLASAMVTPGITVFVAPYVAIGEQVLVALRSHMPIDTEVVPMFGGFKSNTPSHSSNARQVLVATPERFDGWLRSSGCLDRLRSIVFDEMHLIENGVRGAKLEGIISRLRLLQEANYQFRIISLSAVLRDAGALLDWLSVPEDGFHRESWRPTARRLAICRSSGEITWIHATDSLRPPGANFGAQIGKTRFILPETITPFRGPFVPDKDAIAESKNIAEIAHQLAARLTGAGLIVCPRRADTKRVAAAVAERLPVQESAELDELISTIQSQYPWLSPLAENLRRGVAYHNATLPFDVRRIVEEGIRAGYVRFVAATTTLAEGADLPFRWTLIAHWLRGIFEGAEPINPLIFRNIAGRSGRSGSFTEGDTVIYESLLGVSGTVSSNPAIRLKAIARVLIDASPLQSAIRLVSEGNASDEANAIRAVFASQMLAAIPENAGVEDLHDRLAEASYAAYSGQGDQIAQLYTEALDQLIDATPIGGAMAEKNSPVRLTPLGHAANLTGFSPASVRRMLVFLNQPVLPTESGPLVAGLLVELADLPEQGSPYLAKIVQGGRHKAFMKKPDIPGVVTSWLAGASPRTVFEELPTFQTTSSSSETIEDQYEKFLGFIDLVLRNFAPWAIRALATLKDFGSDAAKNLDWKNLVDRLEAREQSGLPT